MATPGAQVPGGEGGIGRVALGAHDYARPGRQAGQEPAVAALEVEHPLGPGRPFGDALG